MKQIHKRWSYRQVTEATEAQIRSLVEQARSKPEEARLFRQWAYGVYLGWESLTVGWRIDGDGERMKLLAESVWQYES